MPVEIKVIPDPRGGHHVWVHVDEKLVVRVYDARLHLEMFRNPEIKALTYRFAEHLVRLRKRHFGPLAANEKVGITAEDIPDGCPPI